VVSAVRLAASPPRPSLGDRRSLLAVGAAVVACCALALAFAIGSGAYKQAAALGGLVLALPLLVLALQRPYVFPYGLYVILVPLDNMLLIPGAGTLTKLLGAASIVFVVVALLRQKRIGRPPLAAYFGLAYFAWLLLSVLWAPDLSVAAIDAQTMGSLVILYAVLSVAPITERELRTVCAVTVVGGTVASLYGMYLLHNLGAAGADYGRLMINIDDRTIDPNHFANALLGPFALALVGLLHARKPGVMLAYGGAVAIIAAGQLISLSREALLGSVLIGAVLIAFSKRRLLGAAVTLPTLGLVLLFVPAIGRRMVEAGATGGAGRSFIWHIVWRAWLQHPLFGWGSGGAIEAYDRNYLTVYALMNQGWGRPPHNTPLHILLELGVVGLVLAGLAYLSVFRQFAGIRRGDELYDLRVALTAALLAAGFVSFFIDLANYKYLWLVLILVAQLRSAALARGTPPAAGPALRARGA
jgi:O-antigen ligase